MGVEPKIGVINPKMDGENNGKPYFLMDDLGGKPTIWGNTHIYMVNKYDDVVVFYQIASPILP